LRLLVKKVDLNWNYVEQNNTIYQSKKNINKRKFAYLEINFFYDSQ